MRASPAPRTRTSASVWLFAFGYFAAYVPYSALTKASTDGTLASLPGTALLPANALASAIGMLTFIFASGWWRAAGRRRVLGRAIPAPGLFTLLSGLSSTAIILTTTLAYTFKGASIVLMMVLMRGGVLLIAPLVDAISGRRVRWFSLVALALSAASLAVTLGGAPLAVTVAAAVDVVVYVASYFVRLRFMSRLAKSDDPRASRRYFVEEQLVASPAMLLVLAVVALASRGAVGHDLRAGFALLADARLAAIGLTLGLCSQLTGVFGALILLAPDENTYCVPVNRASSVLAGVVATLILSGAPATAELAGAGLIVVAIVALTVGPAWSRAGRGRPAAPRAAPPPRPAASATGRP